MSCLSPLHSPVVLSLILNKNGERLFSVHNIFLRSSVTLMETNQLKRFTPFQSFQDDLTTLGALASHGDFLGGLCFLVENWFGLTAKTPLFHVITSFSLGDNTRFTSLVLRDFALFVFLALWPIAESRSLFWITDHEVVGCWVLLQEKKSPEKGVPRILPAAER